VRTNIETRCVETNERRHHFDSMEVGKYISAIIFDVMIHLAIHLPQEAELAGPIQFCWMYPIKRTLGKYKKYVRNKARPEGCIVEGYVVDECSNFCSMYLRGIETRWNHEERNVDSGVEATEQRLDVFSQQVQPFGVVSTVILDHNEFAKAQWYVLSNCNDMASYMK
jgi:hypothetical protein